MIAHTDVGAYSMGLLEEQDRRAFEDHLDECPTCAAELAELSPMAALLRGVEPTNALLAPGGIASPSPPETQVIEDGSGGPSPGRVLWYLTLYRQGFVHP